MAEVETNPFHTAAILKTLVNIPDHEKTVKNRLRAVNLRSRHAIPREVRKEEHIEERLVFAVGNGDRDCKRVFFLMKSPFLLQGRTYFSLSSSWQQIRSQIPRHSCPKW